MESAIAEHTPITTYYIRYDVKFENQQIANENLLMIPAENEFRAEKFSHISLPCVISMTQGESKNNILGQAKNAALKKILRNNGLKSVKTNNMVTLISYEGVIISPVDISMVDISKVPGNDSQKFSFTAQFEFSPMAFPDKWQDLKFKSTIKEKLNDLLLLFQ